MTKRRGGLLAGFSVVAVLAVMLAWTPARVSAAEVYDGCGMLGVLGFPGSCEAACNLGGRDAYTNITCFFDLLMDWT